MPGGSESPGFIHDFHVILIPESTRRDRAVGLEVQS